MTDLSHLKGSRHDYVLVALDMDGNIIKDSSWSIDNEFYYPALDEAFDLAREESEADARAAIFYLMTREDYLAGDGSGNGEFIDPSEAPGVAYLVLDGYHRFRFDSLRAAEDYAEHLERDYNARTSVYATCDERDESTYEKIE